MSGNLGSKTGELSPEQREQVSLVFDKLNLIRSRISPEVTSGEITESSLRDELCTSLRFLLPENHYQIAWNTLGFNERLEIRAVDLTKVLAVMPTDKPHQLFAQGAAHQGVHLEAGIFYQGLLSDEQKEALFLRQQGGGWRTNFRIKQFLEAPAIIVNGVSASRRQIIHYVAYKSGGVHYRPNEKPSGQDQPAFDMLNELIKGADQQEILGHNPVFLEFLAIGQNLVDSKDCARFLKAAAARLPARPVKRF